MTKEERFNKYTSEHPEYLVWFNSGGKKPKRKNPPYCSLRPDQKIAANLRTRLRQSLKHRKAIKGNKTMIYVGCTKEELKKYLEKKFTAGMSWDNYGKWEIDHIKPFAAFDLVEEQELYRVMNYKNLQPLWVAENRRKSTFY